MSRRDSKSRGPSRFATGIPGLDLVAGGGPLTGGIYMVLGRPGAGKTIFGNQLCFNHVASGGKAVFVTLLTESHARMLSHLKVFEFFDPAQIGTSLHYLSGYEVLETEKLPGLLTLLRQVVRQQQATLLVVDGLVTAGAIAGSDLALKKFVHELQAIVELVGCTAFLLTGAKDEADQYAVRTMVDGLIDLSAETVEMSIVRHLEILKLRGGGYLMGRHRFVITDAGLTVFPRTESFLGRTAARPALAGALRSFGIAGLDQMLGGGVQPSGVTMLLGASGSGKTVLGLSFLAAGARRRERGLYLGFSETPEELERNAKGWGADRLQSDHLELSWFPPGEELIPDALAAKLIARVKERKIRRVFIDGVAELQDPAHPRRTPRFFTALCNELRQLGVTTILSEETRDILGPRIELPVSGLAAMLDNIILLRHVELNARLRRLISVVKVRGRGTDSSLRELSIDAGGVEISPTFDSAEAVLTGVARARAEGSRSSGPPSGEARSRSRS